MPKEKHENIKTDKRKSSAKVEDNVQQNDFRSASEPDDASGKTLKLCSDSLARILTELLERSFNEGHIPEVWKMSVIILVPNTRFSSQMNEYIPVAQTSIVF